MRKVLVVAVLMMTGCAGGMVSSGGYYTQPAYGYQPYQQSPMRILQQQNMYRQQQYGYGYQPYGGSNLNFQFRGGHRGGHGGWGHHH